MNIIHPRWFSLILKRSLYHINRNRRDLELPLFNTVEDSYSRSRVLVNTVSGLDYSHSVSPLISHVGPLLLPDDMRGRPLSNKTVNWLSKAGPEGCNVYVHLGALPRLDSQHADGLLKGLSAPNVRVIWLLPADQRSSIPTTLPSSFTVKVMTETLHLHIMAEPSISVAVSHCGMGAVQEILASGKPVLCFPFFGDQVDTARRVSDIGAGLYIDKDNFTPGEIKEKISRLHTEASFRNVAGRIASLLTTSGGVERVADIVANAIVAANHTQPFLPEAEMSSELHVISAAVIILLFIALHSITTLVRYLLFLVVQRQLQVKEKEE
jgi:hypothetical protein